MADEITTKKESALTAKSEVNSTDFLRLIGANGVSYKNLVTDVARYIMENYSGTTLAGSAQTPKASIDALKATNDSQQTSIDSLNGKTQVYISQAGTGYFKLSSGDIVQFGGGTIDVTSPTPDRAKIPLISDFTNPADAVVLITLRENSYNVLPQLEVWNAGSDKYALNKATTPNRHIMFYYVAIGR